MNIKEALTKVQSFEELWPIVEQSNEKLSCLGARYISVHGYEGTLHIDALAERVIAMVRKNFEFTEQERKFGKLIAKKINHIYEENDKRIERSNCFTRILCMIREFLFCPMLPTFGSTRWVWRAESECFAFEYYTRSQFQSVFGLSPEEAKNQGYQLGYRSRTGDPERWGIIKEPSSDLRI